MSLDVSAATAAAPAPCEVIDDRVSPVRHLPLIDQRGERVEPRVRGERALKLVDAGFQRLDAAIQRVLPSRLNPFAQTGAIANTTFLVATVTGVLVLIWYQASVHQAHASVQAMQGAWLPSFVRSLHRYSSDACLFFVLLHALKLFSARRFGGARWLAWVSGLFLLSTLWLVGWLGYWLVWDERAQEVAVGTARMLDELPIFADPPSRSFLTDDGVNSLLFFVVFFLHMLIPLGMGIALWIHIKRLSRAEFLTGRALTLWVLAGLAVVSLAAPADLAAPARMAATPTRMALDYWFLAPVALVDRLSVGANWALSLGAGIALFSLPWTLAAGRARTAAVVPARCTSCNKCYEDCPYDAIDMVARSDGRPYAQVARVDLDKCVGCGICAGSCDSAGIGIPWFDALSQRHRIDTLVESSAERANGKGLLFVCAESAGQDLAIDSAGRVAELPDYHVVRVPCAGWVHPLLAERARRRGASHVLIASCGEGSCRFREGGKWTAQRMTGLREPALRLERVGNDRVRTLALFAHENAELLRQAKDLSALAASDATATPNTTAPGRPLARFAFGLALTASLAAVIWIPSRASYAAPARPDSALLVSFKHAGSSASVCRELSAEEKAKLPAHMRPEKVCDRSRVDVRLRVSLDGRQLVQRSYPPHGIWGDGNSIAIEEFAVPEGPHTVLVEIGDTAEPGAYAYRDEKRISFQKQHKTVVRFDKVDGFRWYD